VTVLAADWDAPATVRAFTTTRAGGVSSAPFDSLNLGDHVGDDPDRVRQNRLLVRESRGWGVEPLWLNQVHGTTIVRAEDFQTGTDQPPAADGSVTALAHRPLVVMTADCLPVVACDRAGTVVGAFHAGWKGLVAGVLEAGLAAMGRPPVDLLVWIGPSIGPESYQVGPEVRDAYLGSDPAHRADFADDGPLHWKFDLAGAAVRRLARLGVGSVARSRWDTLGDEDLFFSHRRSAPVSKTCGRMGTFVCLEPRSLS
jgi:YfiH family protein